MSLISIDPELFTPQAIDGATQHKNAELEFLLSSLPAPWDTGAAAIRTARREGQGLLKFQPKDEDAYWETADALERRVPVRIFKPAHDPCAVLIHIHGGGHTLGAADAQDVMLRGLATRLGMVVASVDYRLAPEHPYPAGPDDCETAALWLTENADRLFGTDTLFIMGESAGANLAATTIIRLRHRHGLNAFTGASLLYGQFDLSGLPAVHSWGERNLVINTPIIKWFNRNYLPEDHFTDDQRRDPDISPLNANLYDLCPVHFTCGTLDPLIDDTLLMAIRWAAAGNKTTLSLYPGAVHAFNLLEGYPLAEAANQAIEEWLAAFGRKGATS